MSNVCNKKISFPFFLLFVSFFLIVVIGCGDESEDQLANTAQLNGRVIMSTMLDDESASEGTLYIALFEEDPAADLANPPMEISSLTLPNIDLSDPNAVVDFTLDNLPIRPEPYYLTGLLDLNNNAQETSLPDKGDVISLMGQSSPQVMIDSTSIDIVLDLNFVFPF